MRAGRLRAGAAALAVAVVAGCGPATTGSGDGSGAGSGGEQRYVAGDGTVTTYDEGSRRAVPALTGTTMAGRPFDLDAYDGQVVLLNVWGSWCPPCRAEAPALERVWRAYRSQDVQLVGINVKDRPAAAQAFLDRFAISYPSLDGNDGHAQLALRGVLPGAIPSTIVIDRAGRLAASVFGPVGEPALRRILDPLLATPA